jgi:hypothetical protein
MAFSIYLRRRLRFGAGADQQIRTGVLPCGELLQSLSGMGVRVRRPLFVICDAFFREFCLQAKNE